MERIILVDKHDVPIGAKLRSEIVPGDMGRSSGLWITDADGNILLARRSFIVKWYPGLLSYAVTGAVSEGESYEETIVREMQEELGISGFVPTKSIKYLVSVAEPNQSWYLQVFTLVLPRDYMLTPDAREVAELKWFSPAELIEEYTHHPEHFVPGFAHETKSFLNL